MKYLKQRKVCNTCTRNTKSKATQKRFRPYLPQCTTSFSTQLNRNTRKRKLVRFSKDSIRVLFWQPVSDGYFGWTSSTFSISQNAYYTVSECSMVTNLVRQLYMVVKLNYTSTSCFQSFDFHSVTFLTKVKIIFSSDLHCVECINFQATQLKNYFFITSRCNKGVIGPLLLTMFQKRYVISFNRKQFVQFRWIPGDVNLCFCYAGIWHVCWWWRLG